MDRRDVYVAGGVLGVLALGGVVIEFLSHAGSAFILTAAMGLVLTLLAVALLIYGLVRSKQRRSPAAVAFAFALTVDVFAILYVGYQPSTAWLLLAAVAIWTVFWLPKSFRRLRATTRFAFSADPAAVFGYLSDFRTQLQYTPRVQAVEKLSDGPVGLGTRFQTRIAGLSPIEVITVFERDHRYASQIEGDPMTGTATFEPSGRGTQATFEVVTTIDYATALVGMALLRPIVAKAMRDQRHHAWTRVDDILKSGGQPTTYD